MHKKCRYWKNNTPIYLFLSIIIFQCFLLTQTKTRKIISTQFVGVIENYKNALYKMYIILLKYLNYNIISIQK